MCTKKQKIRIGLWINNNSNLVFGGRLRERGDSIMGRRVGRTFKRNSLKTPHFIGGDNTIWILLCSLLIHVALSCATWLWMVLDRCGSGFPQTSCFRPRQSDGGGGLGTWAMEILGRAPKHEILSGYPKVISTFFFVRYWCPGETVLNYFLIFF